jgi:hypothetical protein
MISSLLGQVSQWKQRFNFLFDEWMEGAGRSKRGQINKTKRRAALGQMALHHFGRDIREEEDEMGKESKHNEKGKAKLILYKIPFDQTSLHWLLGFFRAYSIVIGDEARKLNNNIILLANFAQFSSMSGIINVNSVTNY